MVEVSVISFMSNFVAKIEDTTMPRKKSGMPFEVYPTPVKGKGATFSLRSLAINNS
jgi:hypothetical protein